METTLPQETPFPPLLYGRALFVLSLFSADSDTEHLGVGRYTLEDQCELPFRNTCDSNCACT